MRGRIAVVVAVAAALLLATLPALAQALIPVPALTGPVVDEVGVLDAAAARRLESLARAARAQEGGKGPQLQYLIVRSLDGEPIEDFSMRVAEAWKVGSRGQDNGVLVTVAVEGRAVRIEVGGGLEGGLTDAQAGRIIRGTIVPAFRQGAYGEGLYAAGEQILGALGALPRDVPGGRRVGPGAGPGVLPVVLPGFFGSGLVVVFILFLVLRLLFGLGARRRRWWWGGPFGGGGFGGGLGGGSWGGGGGGGWSGGGGGFSGGGASGRW